MPWVVLAVAAVAAVAGNVSKQQANAKARKTVARGKEAALEESGLRDTQASGAAASARRDALLNIGVGTPEQQAESQQAYSNYLASAGYQNQLREGQNAISSSAAARGMLDSGATGKALVKYGQNLGSSYFNNYLDQMDNISRQGQQAGSNIANIHTGAATQTANLNMKSGEDHAQMFSEIGSAVGSAYGYGGAAGGMRGGAPAATGTSAGNVYSIATGNPARRG